MKKGRAFSLNTEKNQFEFRQITFDAQSNRSKIKVRFQRKMNLFTRVFRYFRVHQSFLDSNSILNLVIFDKITIMQPINQFQNVYQMLHHTDLNDIQNVTVTVKPLIRVKPNGLLNIAQSILISYFIVLQVRNIRAFQ